MHNLWMVNPNYRFGENAFLPYSAGRLWAYAKAQPDIAQYWTLREIIWQREPIEHVVNRMRLRGAPDVLALSLYIWSERYCLALAKAVHRYWPECVVVVGGPQVPERDTLDWVLDTPGISCAVVGEGEHAFYQVLNELRSGTRPPPVIKGGRAEDLGALPSPYLTGVFDELVRTNPDVKWQVLQETNRGCPYQCTFCDWGSATYSKVRKFELGTCERELQWCADNRIEYIFNCDANFGMLEQDEAFTDALVRCAQERGYPTRFRASYAKKINERVFRVAQKIADAGLSKGATISFQSMDADVLKKVKRLNPVEKTLAETFERYHSAGIPTHSELIIGLPGETLDSFKDGIDRLLEAGQHYGLAIYPCMALRNSELSQPEYRGTHGIETAEVDLLLLHGEPGNDPAPERYEIVIRTNTMPISDWRRAWEFAIVIQGLHCSGLYTDKAKAAHKRGVRYRQFYEDLIRNPPTPVLEGLVWVNHTITHALQTGKWNSVLPWAGRIQWPLEEAFRLIVTRKAFPTLTDDWTTWARDVVWYGRKQATNPEALYAQPEEQAA